MNLRLALYLLLTGGTTICLAQPKKSILIVFRLLLLVTESEQSWFGDDELAIITDAINLNTEGTYNITISN